MPEPRTAPNRWTLPGGGDLLELAADQDRVHLRHAVGGMLQISTREDGAWSRRTVPDAQPIGGEVAALGADGNGALHVVHQVERGGGVVLLHSRCEAR